ncbi:hypothetical protein O6H91_01G060800 [Diphasiastrum complanatum]|uniref:Uncharacterized protein n=1 Tax=Diphasiastrum complanatum TaxID=34168 RepID=A0ACC2ERT9_DIPCM|nr:hypothetical protein O6H91_01G060800 [Diphasiastrum complanatum]
MQQDSKTQKPGMTNVSLQMTNLVLVLVLNGRCDALISAVCTIQSLWKKAAARCRLMNPAGRLSEGRILQLTNCLAAANSQVFVFIRNGVTLS